MPEPLACTLTADQLARRTAAISALARRALRARTRIPGGARLVFESDVATERELRALIAAEAACCPFLELDLQPTPEGLRLDVTGPGDARPLIEGLFT